MLKKIYFQRNKKIKQIKNNDLSKYNKNNKKPHK